MTSFWKLTARPVGAAVDELLKDGWEPFAMFTVPVPAGFAGGSPYVVQWVALRRPALNADAAEYQP